jgi:hypothetical protein
LQANSSLYGQAAQQEKNVHMNYYLINIIITFTIFALNGDTSHTSIANKLNDNNISMINKDKIDCSYHNKNNNWFLDKVLPTLLGGLLAAGLGYGARRCSLAKFRNI